MNSLLISNFRCVLNVVFFILGDSSASKCYVPTFRNTICSIFIRGLSRKNNREETCLYKYTSNFVPVILPAYIAYDDVTDRVFRNVGT